MLRKVSLAIFVIATLGAVAFLLPRNNYTKTTIGAVIGMTLVGGIVSKLWTRYGKRNQKNVDQEKAKVEELNTDKDNGKVEQRKDTADVQVIVDKEADKKTDFVQKSVRVQTSETGGDVKVDTDKKEEVDKVQKCDNIVVADNNAKKLERTDKDTVAQMITDKAADNKTVVIPTKNFKIESGELGTDKNQGELGQIENEVAKENTVTEMPQKEADKKVDVICKTASTMEDKKKFEDAKVDTDKNAAENVESDDNVDGMDISTDKAIDKPINQVPQSIINYMSLIWAELDLLEAFHLKMTDYCTGLTFIKDLFCKNFIKFNRFTEDTVRHRKKLLINLITSRGLSVDIVKNTELADMYKKLIKNFKRHYPYVEELRMVIYCLEKGCVDREYMTDRELRQIRAMIGNWVRSARNFVKTVDDLDSFDIVSKYRVDVLP